MSLESLRLLLEETARVVELADSTQSPPLRTRLLGVIRESLEQVSVEVAPIAVPPPAPLPASLPPPSPIQASNDSVRDVDARTTTTSRGSTRYNQFIGRVTPLLRLQNPQRHPKANMAIAASLWRAYKHMDDDEMMTAVRENINAMETHEAALSSAGLRSLSIESE
jgi:hypothetical protein